MKKSVFSILLIFIASLFLFQSFFNQFVVFKILGIIIIMFSVYRLQSKIPSESNKDDIISETKEEE